MIHLDTNALIALPLWANDGHAVLDVIAAGEPAGVCAICWYEFLIGPVDREEVSLARAFICQNVVPMQMEDAVLAADLYNHIGRRRSLKTDTVIAAMAIRANASLLTINVDDFRPFLQHGLRLA